MAKKDVFVQPAPAPTPTIKDPSKAISAKEKIKQTSVQQVKKQSTANK